MSTSDNAKGQLSSSDSSVYYSSLVEPLASGTELDLIEYINSLHDNAPEEGPIGMDDTATIRIDTVLQDARYLSADIAYLTETYGTMMDRELLDQLDNIQMALDNFTLQADIIREEYWREDNWELES